MTNRIDKIFSDKLSNHAVPPSPNAWANVQANLRKKNSAIVWFRMAAVILLPLMIAGAVYLMRSTAQKENSLSINKNSQNTKKSSRPAEGKNNDNKGSASVNQKSPKPPHSISKGTVAILSKSLEDSPHSGLTAANVSPSSVSNDSVARGLISRAIPDPPVTIAQRGPTVNLPKSEMPFVIEYTLPTPTPAVEKAEKSISITIVLKEKKGLQKVIEFARDAAPFAAIRDAKNDLFAFNFKKDKTKNK